MDVDHERHFVQSFARGLEVVRTFAQARDRLSVAEVADLTGLSSAAARRFVLTLSGLGYLRAEGRHYVLTTKVLELGDAYLASTALPVIAQPHLDELVSTVRQATPLTVLDSGIAVREGDAVVYIAYIRAEALFVLNVSTGSRYPAWVASTGRVLLGSDTEENIARYIDRVELIRYTDHTVTSKVALRRTIADVARQGWAIVDQEFDDRLCSYAVPVHDGSRNAVAAVNVSVMHNAKCGAEHHDAVIERLTDTARRIETSLRQRGRE
ncbi:helix-turn-helix domain-containing protein [Mycolicibacterium goodii]|uniref:IclR family transcriptional regulator domain-containing protein n=1 Tax=Mycolicibacterium TaxID=1866885 RepID=UPI00130376A8|nr:MULTISPECIES: IclR family transcriptional regulator C-terminal domain-containing protein [Mycolicibacterium]ULN48260.1 helix-turn-helix domain-containing protein [Mycolicibacterium goodii]